MKRIWRNSVVLLMSLCGCLACTDDQVKLFNNAGEALNLNLMSVCPLHVLLGESTEHDVNIGINIGSWKVDPEIELE